MQTKILANNEKYAILKKVGFAKKGARNSLEKFMGCYFQKRPIIVIYIDFHVYNNINMFNIVMH